MMTIAAKIAAALLGLLALASCPAESGGEARCLLVGCDRFVSMPSSSPVSCNNVGLMAELLEDFLPGEVSAECRTEGADSADTLAAWAEEAFRGAGEGDACILYLSTHGALRPETEAGMALLLSDGTSEADLSPAELRAILEKLPGRKVLIVDACYSGGLIGAGAEGAKDWFEGSGCEVLASGGAEEDSWFWNAETDEYAGTGYFTAALNSALRASDPDQVDPDGDGGVTLEELAARLREIHGVSTPCAAAGTEGEPLFRLPENRKAGSLLRAVRFGGVSAEGDALVLPIDFRAEEPVRLMYLLVPSRGGRWDFEHAVRMPDREITGLVRGRLGPGEKHRTIRLNRASLGEDGRALLQIVSLRGEAGVPWAEAGRVIEFLPPGEENPAGE